MAPSRDAPSIPQPARAGRGEATEFAPDNSSTRESWQLNSHLDLVFDFVKHLCGEPTQRWINQAPFLHRGHLIALGPGVNRQASLFGPDRHPEGKFSVLNLGKGDETDIEGVSVEDIGGKNDCGPTFIQRDEIHLSPTGRPARGDGRRHNANLCSASSSRRAEMPWLRS